MGAGTKTQGIVLLNYARMMDVAARSATKIETAPDEVMQGSQAILTAIIES